MDAISSALSGLTAQKTRLATSADNIANLSSAGYVPKETVLTPQDGGVTARVVDRDGATFSQYNPQSPLAGPNGLVIMPDISLIDETVNMMTAEIAYKANISIMKTAQDMEEALLDTLA